jgi:hypothetical protein
MNGIGLARSRDEGSDQKKQSRRPERPNQRTTSINSIVAPREISFEQFVLFESPDRRSYDQRENIRHRQNCDVVCQSRTLFADMLCCTKMILFGLAAPRPMPCAIAHGVARRTRAVVGMIDSRHSSARCPLVGRAKEMHFGKGQQVGGMLTATSNSLFSVSDSMTRKSVLDECLGGHFSVQAIVLYTANPQPTTPDSPPKAQLPPFKNYGSLSGRDIGGNMKPRTEK